MRILAPSSRRSLRAVIDLKDPAMVKSVLASAATSAKSLNGASSVNALSDAKLTAAAGGIANANTLATSAINASVRLPLPSPQPRTLLLAQPVFLGTCAGNFKPPAPFAWVADSSSGEHVCSSSASEFGYHLVCSVLHQILASTSSGVSQIKLAAGLERS